METTWLWLEESNITDDLIVFVQQKKVLENPVIGIRALSRELNVSGSTMKLALNEYLRHYSYKHHRGELLTEKTHEHLLTKGKILLSSETSC